MKPNVITKKISVNSFLSGMNGREVQKIKEISRAEISYNFDVKSGKLKNGKGVSLLAENSIIGGNDIKFLNVYPYVRYNAEKGAYEEKLLFYASNKRLYLASISGGYCKLISNDEFLEKPTVNSYNYLDNDVLLISSSTDGLYVFDGAKLSKIDGAPAISSICVHNERIFATSAGEGRSLWFSDDFDVTNWSVSLTEGGFINFTGDAGKLLKAVSFLGYVYVFREYGIVRVIANGDQESYSVDNLFGKHGKIYGKSVTECGDFIIMVTSSGIYSFNGLNSSKILSEYDEILSDVDNSDAKGVFDGKNVYLLINANIDGNVEKILISYDVRNKTSLLSRNLDICDLCFYGGSLNSTVCILNSSNSTCVIDEGGCVLDVPTTKVWESAYSDFSISEKIKNLKAISVYTKENATLEVITRSKTLKYSLIGGKTNVVHPCLREETFKIKLSSSALNPEIYGLTVFVDYVKERV